MARVTVNVRGLSGTARALAAYAERVRRAVAAVVLVYTELIVREAKGLAPVDEGDLRSSIRYALEADALGARVIAGGIPGAETGKQVDYAGFVEFGTSKAAAQPFLFPALERYRSDFRKAVRDAVRGAA